MKLLFLAVVLFSGQSAYASSFVCEGHGLEYGKSLYLSYEKNSLTVYGVYGNRGPGSSFEHITNEKMIKSSTTEGWFNFRSAIGDSELIVTNFKNENGTLKGFYTSKLLNLTDFSVYCYGKIKR